jgi:hypothetical protein
MIQIPANIQNTAAVPKALFIIGKKKVIRKLLTQSMKVAMDIENVRISFGNISESRTHVPGPIVIAKIAIQNNITINMLIPGE